MKEIFIDVETTGLSPEVHSIWQIAFIIFVGQEEKERHNLKSSPIPGSKVDDKALKVSGIKKEDFKSFYDSYKTLSMLKTILERYIDPYDKKDKFHFYAYNASFDTQFLRAFFQRQGDKFFGSWFWTPSIDVMSLAGEYLKEDRSSMKDFKQMTVAEKLGIEVDSSRLHDAMYDIELCRKIYEIVGSINQIRSNIERN